MTDFLRVSNVEVEFDKAVAMTEFANLESQINSETEDFVVKNEMVSNPEIFDNENNVEVFDFQEYGFPSMSSKKSKIVKNISASEIKSENKPTVKEEYPDNENFVAFHEVKTEKVENTGDIYYDQDPAGQDPLNTTGRNCNSVLEKNTIILLKKSNPRID